MESRPSGRTYLPASWRTLAILTPEIASLLNLNEATVAAWENLFFDVRGHRDAFVWVYSLVIAPEEKCGTFKLDQAEAEFGVAKVAARRKRTRRPIIACADLLGAFASGYSPGRVGNSKGSASDFGTNQPGGESRPFPWNRSLHQISDQGTCRDKPYRH
jgi:hypothetical protein